MKRIAGEGMSEERIKTTEKEGLGTVRDPLIRIWV